MRTCGCRLLNFNPNCPKVAAMCALYYHSRPLLSPTRSLQRTLAELRDYQRKHEFWQAENDKVIGAQASLDFRYEQQLSYERHKERENSVNIGESRSSAMSAAMCTCTFLVVSSTFSKVSLLLRELRQHVVHRSELRRALRLYIPGRKLHLQWGPSEVNTGEQCTFLRTELPMCPFFGPRSQSSSFTLSARTE